MPAVGAPGIRSALGLNYAGLTLWVMTLPLVVTAIVEPPLLLALSGVPRMRTLRAAGFVLAVGHGLCAIATEPFGLAGGLCVVYLSTGVAVTLAQTCLMDTYPDARERWMARWTLLGCLGDLAAPWVIVTLGGGHRAAFAACAALSTVLATAVPRVDPSKRPSDDAPDDAGRTGLGAHLRALRRALRNRALLAWTLGGLLCGLLDELLVTFVALHLRDGLGFDATTRSMVLMAGSAGATIGLLGGEWLLARWSGMRLLVGSSLACLASLCGLLLCAAPLAAMGCMALVGLTAAPHYPIVQARAYAALPEDSMLVAVVDSVVFPLGLGLPYLLGFIADHVGLRAALTVLALQPVGLLVLATALGRRRG